jgi:hypothetical protein
MSSTALESRRVMSDMLSSNRAMRRKKTAQDAPGTIFSRESLSGIPLFLSTCALNAMFRVSPSLELFAPTKTVWTLPSLWTQRTRPQRLAKPQRTRFRTSAHTDCLFLEKKKPEEGTTALKLQVCQLRLSQQRGSPQPSNGTPVEHSGNRTRTRDPLAATTGTAMMSCLDPTITRLPPATARLLIGRLASNGRRARSPDGPGIQPSRQVGHARGPPRGCPRSWSWRASPPAGLPPRSMRIGIGFGF